MWRREGDSNPPVTVLQTAASPIWLPHHNFVYRVKELNLPKPSCKGGAQPMYQRGIKLTDGARLELAGRISGLLFSRQVQ